MHTIYFVEGGMKRILSLLMVGIVIFLSSGGANAQGYQDQDKDGLIEISYIETLDSMRYNLAGACSPAVCNGYELTKRLNFRSAGSYRNHQTYITNRGDSSFYAMNRGWNPIGTSASAFNAIFEGNGYTIDSMYIKRTTNYGGLFGYIQSNTRIRNIGVTNVSVSSRDNVGALVGSNIYGTITQSYATGSVSGYNSVGGLVGINYGGKIIQSYATGSVSGAITVGGLVGSHELGTISQSYATGSVTGSSNRVGGLVGRNSGGGKIIQSYATGSVSGSSDVGGLVGYFTGQGTAITHGYWNKDASQDTVVGVLSARSNSNKLGIGSGSGTFAFVKALTGSALKSPTAKAIDSIRELGPGFIYRQGQLPRIHTGARVTVNGVDFTQTLPSITNIVSGSAVADTTHGRSTTRATLTVAGIGFTANLIGVTSIITPFTITNIQNGVKKLQTIIFTSLGNKTFETRLFVLPATSSEGLTVSFSASNNLVSISNDTLRIKGVGTVSITAYQTGDDSYLKADSVVQILTISKGSQSITFDALASKTFGAGSFVLSATSSAGLTVLFSASNTLLVGISNNIVTIKGAGTVNITAYSLENGTIIFGATTQVLTISKANRSISFGALARKTFVDAPFILSATSSAGLRVSFSSSNIAIASININSVTIKGVGTVNITAYSLENDTIFFASKTQILTINKGNQSIRFDTLAQKTFGDGAFVLSATSSGGLSVSYSSSNTAIASININSVTINGVGTVSIKAYQTGDTNYLKADSVVRILTIHKASQSITFGTIAQKNNRSEPFVLSASSSVGLTVLYSSSNTAIASININTVTINAGGTVNMTAYQVGNEQYNPAASAQNITVLDLALQLATINFTAIPNLTIGQKYVLMASSNSPVAITFASSDNNKLSIEGNTATANASGNVTITANQAGNAQFNPASSAQNIAITDPALKVSLINFTAIPNLNIGQKYVLIVSSNSPVAITFTSSDNDKLSIIGNTATAKAKGNVIITANQARNAEYNAADAVIRNVTVLDPNLLVSLITFTAIPNLTVGQKYTLVASSNSPVAITFTSSDERIATVSGNILTAKAKGNVTITANQEGNAQFNAATSTQNITVLSLVSLINFTAIPSLTIGQKYTIVASSNSPVAIAFASSNLQVATVSGNTLTAVGTGTAVITANQAENAQFNATTAQQTVTVINKTGTTTPTGTAALTFVETPHNSIRIFPNPANDYITISYDKTQKVSSVKIYDMTGKSYELKMSHDELGMKADVKNLPKGEYILVIYGEKGEVLKTELLVISF